MSKTKEKDDVNEKASPATAVMKQCPLCNKFFTYKSYWYHANKTKKLCMPKETVLNEIKQGRGKVVQFEKKVEKLEKKVKESNKEVESLKKQLEIYKSFQSHMSTPTIINYDNCDFSTKNVNVNITDKNGIDERCNVTIAPPKTEKLDHLKPDMILAIMNCQDFDFALSELVRVVYFNPLAPHNHRWCVPDKKSKYGGLEYDHKSKLIVSRDTNEMVEDNYQYVISELMDLLENVKDSHGFNKRQILNYDLIYDTFGGDKIDKKHVNNFKELGYKYRNMIKSLWDQLELARSVVKLSMRQKPLMTWEEMNNIN